MFAYFDNDVIAYESRYAWSKVDAGDWLYFISDITVLVRWIDKVMTDIGL